jgi:hypothetical protein
VVSGAFMLAYGEWMNYGGKIAGVRKEGPPGKAAARRLSTR